MLGTAALAPMLPEPIVRRLGGGLWLPAAHASPGCTLNPQDPTGPGSDFVKGGNQNHTPGAVLTLFDQSGTDFVAFFATCPDAAAGNEVDVITTFQITATSPANADVGNRIVINDGVTRSAIAACIIQNGERGIGLLSQGSPSDPAAYPAFVPVDWRKTDDNRNPNPPVTVRLRRTAAASQCPAKTRNGPTVEFGCRSPEAECTVEYAAFTSEKVIIPVAGTLNVTRFRLRDADSVDRIRFRADFTLGANSNNIDPAAEPMTIKLSTPTGGQFYPSPDFNPLNGFDVRGSSPRRRWTLNDSERARTGIERFDFDEDPNKTGAVFLRDFRTNIADADYSTVNVELTIGTGATQDKLTASRLTVAARRRRNRGRRMDKRRAFMLALIAITTVVAAAACGSSESKPAAQATHAAPTQPTTTRAVTTTRPAAPAQKFMSQRYGLRVTLTEDWSEADALVDWNGKELQGLGSAAFARFTDPATGRTLVAAAARVAKGMELAEWRAVMVRAAPAVCSESSSVEETTLGGEPALAWTATCSDGYDGNKLAALHGRRGYMILLASLTANDNAEDRRIFESIRRSFRFTR